MTAGHGDRPGTRDGAHRLTHTRTHTVAETCASVSRTNPKVYSDVALLIRPLIRYRSTDRIRVGDGKSSERTRTYQCTKHEARSTQHAHTCVITPRSMRLRPQKQRCDAAAGQCSVERELQGETERRRGCTALRAPTADKHSAWPTDGRSQFRASLVDEAVRSQDAVERSDGGTSLKDWSGAYGRNASLGLDTSIAESGGGAVIHSPSQSVNPQRASAFHLALRP